MNLRIGVVGSGAIGIYYGGKLAAAGGNVHFLVRTGLDIIRARGFQINGRKENVRLPNVNCHGSAHEMGPCDLVLVAVKSTANGDLLHLIPPLLHDDTLLLTLQNGLGNEEFLAGHFGEKRVLGGLCFVCLKRVSPGVVDYYERGDIYIGEFKRKPEERTYRIADQFRRAGIECSVVEDLALERWRKLVWNISFNGLSILAGGIDTESILADPTLRETALGLMEEVIAAANRCGSPLKANEGREQLRRTESITGYKPSTLLDYEAGNPLEIESIWGEPLRRALAAGSNVPRLQLVYSMLQSIDRVRDSKGSNR